MNKLMLTTAALIGALSFPALAAEAVVDGVATPNDLASAAAMDTAITNSATEMAEMKALSTVGEVVVINTASFNETSNDVASWDAMMEKGKALSPELQAAIAANPALLAKIQTEQPDLDLATVYAVNVTTEGAVYLYTS